jgi:hypothetical protein
MNEATVLLLDHNRNEIMVRNDAFLVETTLMARIDCKRLSSVTALSSPLVRLPLARFLFSISRTPSVCPLTLGLP